jgi:hypothetical protein
MELKLERVRARQSPGDKLPAPRLRMEEENWCIINIAVPTNFENDAERSSKR